MMYYCCIILLVTYLCIQAVNLITAWVTGFDTPSPDTSPQPLPSVAVLVAARNEELNLRSCLTSLVNQNYPNHLLEIWVGNDQSEDGTERIIDEFVSQYACVKKLNITHTIGLAKGKANVLAQLAHQTKASVFFITDADIQVQPEWINTLLGFFKQNTGIVSGTTIVNNTGYLAPMQQIDWLYFMGLLLSFNHLKMRSTAVGNNMAVARDAYFSTGGYENLPFSVTEDYKLFKAVRNKGWKTVNMLHPLAVNISAPAANFNTLMNQRKRWLTGAKELPLQWWFIFGIFGAFIPAICLLFLINPIMATGIYLAKFSFQSITIYTRQKQLALNTFIIYFFVYEVYTITITVLTIIYFLLPKKLNWKNRYY